MDNKKIEDFIEEFAESINTIGITDDVTEDFIEDKCNEYYSLINPMYTKKLYRFKLSKEDHRYFLIFADSMDSAVRAYEKKNKVLIYSIERVSNKIVGVF